MQKNGKSNQGIYSCINEIRSALHALLRNGIVPKSISFEKTLSRYRQPGQDLYPILYQKNECDPEVLISAAKKFRASSKRDRFLPTWVDYSTIEFPSCKIIDDTYFAPSELVTHRVSFLKEKYNIDESKTLVVLHRGTDKFREAKPANVVYWVDKVKKELRQDMSLFLQTDDIDFLNSFLEFFPSSIVFYDEMLFGKTHQSPKTNQIEWCINFEAIMRMISECAFVITHAGNTGVIPILYRGNAKNVIQLLHNGQFK